MQRTLDPQDTVSRLYSKPVVAARSDELASVTGSDASEAITASTRGRTSRTDERHPSLIYP
jgi:hypothetical protein